jgi:hypothetical protein
MKLNRILISCNTTQTPASGPKMLLTADYFGTSVNEQPVKEQRRRPCSGGEDPVQLIIPHRYR